MNARTAAIFLAAILLNPVMATLAAEQYPLLAYPFPLIAGLAVHATFLIVAIVYLPARFAARHGRTLSALAGDCLGEVAERGFRLVLVPVWAGVCFASLSAIAAPALLRFWYGPYHQPPFWTHVAAAAVWAVVVAPGAALPLPRLAASSVFLAKVSFVALLGVGLSIAEFAPAFVARQQAFHQSLPNAVEPWIGSSMLLWAVPPVFLATELLPHLALGRRRLLAVACAGVGLSFALVLFAGLVPMAGAAFRSQAYRKLPVYLELVAERHEKYGWVKLLLMGFALLVPARFALNRIVDSVPRLPRAGTAIVASTALTSAGNWSGIYWLGVSNLVGLTFVSLAGVIAAGFCTARLGTFDRRSQRVGLFGFGSGIVAPVLVTFHMSSSRFEETSAPVAGWLTAFLITAAGRLRSARSRARNE